ncbi:helix-turn-helix domain-containing protein [Chloroflexota bacterium]
MARRNVIGERVRLARERAKPLITQADLAARLQIEGLQLERVTISKIETGYREVTDVETVAIAKALGVTISWLMGESEEIKSK